jgi:hypothetical protein
VLVFTRKDCRKWQHQSVAEFSFVTSTDNQKFYLHRLLLLLLLLRSMVTYFGVLISNEIQKLHVVPRFYSSSSELHNRLVDIAIPLISAALIKLVGIHIFLQIFFGLHPRLLGGGVPIRLDSIFYIGKIYYSLYHTIFTSFKKWSSFDGKICKTVSGTN